MRASWAVLILELSIAGPAVTADEAALLQESIRADKIERSSDGVLRATGNVRVTSAMFRLRADSVVFHETSAPERPSVELTAEGNVVLMRADERITLQRLRLNAHTGAGVFQLPEVKKK